MITEYELCHVHVAGDFSRNVSGSGKEEGFRLRRPAVALTPLGDSNS